ncbi:hypothetical protein BDZ91DRAFT_725987 [Kalaharituber pfeilii]|nr:hypothetical protein BDZ91DRAFT_725987 [Kalaharituber pfeilii]
MPRRNKAKRALEEFLRDIPDAKLQSPFGTDQRTIYDSRCQNFRFDMQGVTAGGTAWNLQIQANFEAPIRAVREWAPRSVCKVILPYNSEILPDELRKKFLQSSTFHNGQGLREDGSFAESRLTEQRAREVAKRLWQGSRAMVRDIVHQERAS